MIRAQHFAPQRTAASALAIAIAFAIAASSCAPLLGGLEEGTSRDGGGAVVVSTPAPTSVATDAGTCGPWLDGYAHRFRVDVESATKLDGHSLPFSFNSRKLVDAHELRADGADLRVTRGDGITIAPHWIESGLGGEATIAWTKLDLDAGPSAFFVYYGNDSAQSTNSLDDTFVSGIVTNGRFDHGSAPWIASGPTIGGTTANLTIREGEAHVDLALDGFQGVDSAGFCQSVTFPAGSRYRIVFDLAVLDAGNATFRVWTGSVAGHEIWSGFHDVTGPMRGVMTRAVDPGATRLCIGGSLLENPSGHFLNGSFSNVRVARYADVEPMAKIAGPEESPCARR